MNARSRLTGIATGDQAIFVERALFDAVGRYPDQPLMEDVELSRRLKRAAGAPLCVSKRVVNIRPALGSPRAMANDLRDVAGFASPTGAAWRPRGWPGATRRSRPSRVTLQIFAKNPVPGQVKTRLAIR